MINITSIFKGAPLFPKADAGSLPVGTPARKIGGSYQATGVIVGNFKTTMGEQRYIFEFNEPQGMLHIFGPSQVQAISLIHKGERATMTDTTTPPLIGCVQHDCAKCKARDAEIERLWKEREEPNERAGLYMRECNRLERERDTAQADLARVRQELICALEREKEVKQCSM